MDGNVATGTGRTVAAGVAGLLGAVGAGMVFVTATANIATQVMMGSFDWLSTELTWAHALAPAFLAGMLVVATVVGRWGWWAAAGALATQLVLAEAQWTTYLLGPVETSLVFAVTGGAVMGGALAGYGAAGRAVRPWIGAGMAIGLYGGWMLTVALLVTWIDVIGNRNAHYATLGVPFVLCLVAAVGWLVAGSGRDRPVGPRRWSTPVIVLILAAVAIALELGLRAVLDGLATRERRPEAVETLHQVGTVAIVQVVAAVLAVVAYRRGGTILSRWVLVGFAAGYATGVTGIWQGRDPDAYWLLGVAAVIGAVGGTLIGRIGNGAIPWDALGLAALCLGVVQILPRGRLELAREVSGFQVFTVFAIAFALAATLVLVNSGVRGLSGSAEGALSVGVGFVALLLAALAGFPPTLTEQVGNVTAGPAATIGSDALAVFLLFLFGLLVRRARRGAEAEAAREVDAPAGAP